MDGCWPNKGFDVIIVSSMVHVCKYVCHVRAFSLFLFYQIHPEPDVHIHMRKGGRKKTSHGCVLISDR